MSKVRSKPVRVKFYTKDGERIAFRGVRTYKGKSDRLGERLCRILMPCAGERGDNEGAEETMIRVIDERDYLAREIRYVRGDKNLFLVTTIVLWCVLAYLISKKKIPTP